MESMNEELVNALKTVLADHYSLYFKAQGYHWNVEGSDFQEYHALFSNIYEDAIGAVDGIAENIRKLNAYAPFKMSRFVELTTLTETEIGSDPSSMVLDLLVAIEAAIASNLAAFACAGMCNEQGIANDLADRDGLLKKWRWQLRSSAK
jgi:starvation-inducible DNA-binding protein